MLGEVCWGVGGDAGKCGKVYWGVGEGEGRCVRGVGKRRQYMR